MYRKAFHNRHKILDSWKTTNSTYKAGDIFVLQASCLDSPKIHIHYGNEHTTIMTPEHFEAVKKAIQISGRRKAGKSMDAVRLVIIDGMRASEACRASGGNPQAVSRLLKAFDRYKFCECCQQAHRIQINT